MHPQVVNYQQYLCNIYTLEVQQFAHEKMMAKEDDPFLLKGSGNCSGKVKLPGGTRGSIMSHSGINKIPSPAR